MELRKWLLGAGALVLAAGAQAATIAYDDFAVDGDLDGSSGGSGFSTNWYNNPGGYTISGGVVNGTGSSYRTLNSTLGSNGTIWVSFDYGVDSDQETWGGLSFFEGTSTERMIIGDTYGQDLWGLDGKSGSTKLSSTNATLGYKTGVAKITLGSGASSVVRLWVGDNAVDPVECPTVADVTITSVTLENCDTLRISTGGTLNFGNLIIGDTAADVGAIEIADITVYAEYTSGSWTNESNWSDGIPAASDDAILGLGAGVTLDTAETIAKLTMLTDSELTVAAGGALTCTDLSLGSSVALEIAAGSSVTVGTDIDFGPSSTLTVGIDAGSDGVFNVGGVFDLSDITLTIDGTLDLDGHTIAYAAGGFTNEFSNYGDGDLVQRIDEVNYYINYVTSSVPHFIEVSTNGSQFADITLPPRPEELLIVDGFDQRYMAYDYDPAGTWKDSAASQDAAAVNVGDFALTTNAPNGRPAVVNVGSNNTDTAMTFTRTEALGGQGFTVQAVIRVDDGNTSLRQGPVAMADGGWGGLFMGARTEDDGNVRIRAGNQDSGSASVLQVEDTMTGVTDGTWGIYTLLVDASTNPVMTATFDLLADGSTVFEVTYDIGSTNDIGKINTAGRLFGGDMGGGDETANWMGAIADIVVYNSVLTSDQLATNEAAFQTLYLDDIDYNISIGDLAIEAISGTQMVLTWATSEYGTFALESTESLSVPDWADVEGATGIEGTGGDVSVTTTVSGAETFYRAYIED